MHVIDILTELAAQVIPEILKRLSPQACQL